MNFVVSQFVLLGNGILPLQVWRSFPQAVSFGSRGLLRALLGLLNVSWLLSATAWFVGVYYALPSLAFDGKIGSFIILALIWILGGIVGLTTVLPGKPQTPLDSPPPLPAK
jgi:hypothetical protein